jgi:anti-sigma regulatory factor (Ser/Thr protein kinase)
MAHLIAHRFYLVAIRESSGVAEVRRLARTTALDAGLPETQAEQAAIIATESATNLVKHAKGGDVIVRTAAHAGGLAVDILAIDRGPGMANVGECLQDGYSSVGTRGHGLGAIARQAAMFDIFSRRGQGTVLLARVGTAAPDGPPASTRALVVDGLSISKRGESVCGDAWTSANRGATTGILVADGLGHGEIAAEAATEAVKAYHQHASLAPLDALDRVHRALVKTRGAAVAAALIDAGRGELKYAGMGNISATIEGGERPARHLVSAHGTAGHQARRLQEFSYPWPDDAVLIMHSDGVTAHWSLDAYPGLSQRHPAVIAAILLRDFSRLRDDATVVVAKAQQ